MPKQTKTRTNTQKTEKKIGQKTEKKEKISSVKKNRTINKAETKKSTVRKSIKHSKESIAIKADEKANNAEKKQGFTQIFAPNFWCKISKNIACCPKMSALLLRPLTKLTMY